MVGFTQSSYNTSEDEGLLQVCASISVELEVNVSVNIQSEDIIAQGTCQKFVKVSTSVS